MIIFKKKLFFKGAYKLTVHSVTKVLTRKFSNIMVNENGATLTIFMFFSLSVYAKMYLYSSLLYRAWTY